MRTVFLSFAFSFVLTAADQSTVHYVGKTKYLNNAHAIVAHTIDDSTKYVTNCIDAMDKYGIKATIFVSTEQDPAPEDRFLTQLQVRELWPRLRKAIDNGHEIGSHLPPAPLQASRHRDLVLGNLQRLRSNRIERRHPPFNETALRVDLVLPLWALRQLRIHSEEDCRRRLHCCAQLSR